MTLNRSLVITSLFILCGLSATMSSGQTFATRYASHQELSDPWSLKPWSIDSSSLFLFRSDPGSSQLVSSIVGDPSNSVNAEDLSYGFAYGYQLQLERQLTHRTRFESRYFGTDDWDDRTSQATTPNQFFSPQLVQVGSSAIPRTAGTSIQSRLASKLYSFELNMNHQVTQNIEAIAGFRYVRLKDNLSLNIPDASIPIVGPVPTVAQTEASNDLFGGQIGARARLWGTSRLSLTTDFKGGIYGNGAHQRSSIATQLPLVGNLASTANDFDDTVAFVGEWTLQTNYKLTDRWSVDLGYQLLWIDGVAVGTDQLAASDYKIGNIGPGNGIDSKDHVFYQGILLGIDYTW